MIVSVAKRPDGRPVSVWGVGPIFAAALPLSDFLFRIGPPHPFLAPLLTSLVMVAVLFLIFQFGFALKPKILSRLLMVFMIAFLICAIVYIVFDNEYVIDRPSDGRTQRVVVGYQLKTDLARQIKVEADAVLAQRERDRDPLQTAASVDRAPTEGGKNQPRDADTIAPFKTEEQIRDERVAQIVGSTGDGAAPYTASSITVMTYTLLLLWLITFAFAAACVGILTVASKIVVRRGALKPRAV
jgi:hypothetical protein